MRVCYKLDLCWFRIDLVVHCCKHGNELFGSMTGKVSF
jgi:hypothetical protein